MTDSRAERINGTFRLTYRSGLTGYTVSQEFDSNHESLAAVHLVRSVMETELGACDGSFIIDEYDSDDKLIGQIQIGGNDVEGNTNA